MGTLHTGGRKFRKGGRAMAGKAGKAAGKQPSLRQRFNAIRTSLEGLGVYRVEFDPAVWALAKIEEEVDAAWAEY